MVKSLENGTSLPPFLVKCYEMVNDESTNELISWTESNDSFIICDESKFSSQLLPKYFKHSNFSSFVRQLNIYVRLFLLEYLSDFLFVCGAYRYRILVKKSCLLCIASWVCSLFMLFSSNVLHFCLLPIPLN